MAGDTTKDVELRIRARDYSQKTLEQVVKSLEELADAQSKQLDAAKKGEVSAKALEDAYRRIEQAAQALAKQGALIKTFEAQNRALTETKQRVEALRVEQERFAASLSKSEQPTKAQTKQIADYERAVRNAEKAQQQAADRVEKTAGRLAEYGIETANIAQAQQRIVSAIAQANQALERQDAALTSLDADVRQHKASLAATEQAEREFTQAVQSSADAQARAAAEAAGFADQRARNLATNRAIEYERMWAQLLDQREEKERQVAKAAKDRADFERAISAQREKEIAAQLEAQAAAEKERQTLIKLADQLDATNRSYQGLARTVETLARYNLGQSLKDIADPSSAALRSLSGVEQSLAKLEARTKTIAGPVKGAADAFRDLAAAQKQITAVGQQIDAYRQQIDVLKQARAQYVAARTEAVALSQQMRSGVGGENLNNQLAQTQARLRAASEEMRRQTSQARQMRDALRAAGVDTADLARAEQQLVTQAERAVQTTNRLTEAVKKYGAARQDAGDKVRKAAEGERTTLSLMQRLRGEVLSLTASYVGLYGAIGTASAALDVTRDQAKIESRLQQVFGGDPAKVAEELSYLRTQADRIGLSFREAALAYSKFLLSSNEAGFSLQESRYIFEQFATSAVKSGLSMAEFDGVMLAITQSISKGKIQAEELTGQLAERLPGALQKLAKGRGTSTEQLVKDLQSGAVSARELINLAGQLETDNAKVADSAATALVKAEGRFQTAKDDFLKALAEGGFTDAYTEFLNKLTTLLGSERGEKLAKALSDGFTLVIKVLELLADNIEVVGAALTFLAANAVFGWLVKLVGIIGEAGAAVRLLWTRIGPMVETFGKAAGGAAEAAGGIGKLTLALRILGRAIPILGWLWTAWEVGSYVMDKFSNSADKAADAAKRAADAAKNGPPEVYGDRLDRMAGTGATQNPGTGVNRDDQQLADAEKAQKKLDEQLRAARMRGAKSELAERQRLATEELTQRREAIEKEIRDEGKRAEALKIIDAQIAQVRLIEQTKFNNERARQQQTAGDNEETLARQIAQDLARIEDDLEKKASEADPTAPFEQRLKARLEAISHEYDKLGEKIAKYAKFNPAGSADAKAKLDAFVKARQEVEATKAKQEELNRLEKALSDVQATRSAKLEEINAQYQAGALTIDQMKEKVADVNNVYGLGIEKASQALRQFATEIRALLDPAQYEQLIARLNVVDVQNDPARTNAQNDVTTQEEAVNRLLAQRAGLLQELEVLKQTGKITDEEYVARQNQINGMFRQQIIDGTTVLLSYIEILKTQFANNPEMMAKLEEMRLKFQGIRLEAETMKQSFTQLEQIIGSGLANTAVAAIEGMAQAMAQMILGQKTAAQGFKALAQTVVQGFAQMMKEAAMYIIKLQLIKMLQSMGPYGQAAAAALQGSMGVGAKHRGGMAGSPSGMRREVHPTIFANAQRLHSGGMPGLSNNEVPAVLLKNEEVLTRDDPRHVLNGGKQAAAGGGQRFVFVDDRAKVPEAMSSAEGEAVTIMNLRRNIATVKQLVGVS